MSEIIDLINSVIENRKQSIQQGHAAFNEGERLMNGVGATQYQRSTTPGIPTTDRSWKEILEEGEGQRRIQNNRLGLKDATYEPPGPRGDGAPPASQNLSRLAKAGRYGAALATALGIGGMLYNKGQNATEDSDIPQSNQEPNVIDKLAQIAVAAGGYGLNAVDHTLTSNPTAGDRAALNARRLQEGLDSLQSPTKTAVSAKPSATAEKPSATAEKPSAPAEKPSAPAEKPSAPAEKPSAPVTAPGDHPLSKKYKGDIYAALRDMTDQQFEKFVTLNSDDLSETLPGVGMVRDPKTGKITRVIENPAARNEERFDDNKELKNYQAKLAIDAIQADNTRRYHEAMMNQNFGIKANAAEEKKTENFRKQVEFSGTTPDGVKDWDYGFKMTVLAGVPVPPEYKEQAAKFLAPLQTELNNLAKKKGSPLTDIETKVRTEQFKQAHNLPHDAKLLEKFK